MAIGRAERREEREPRVSAVFGADSAPAALDLLELVDLAWHDCYGEVAPPAHVLEDMLTLSDGDLDRLVKAGHLAVTDFRDLKVAAQDHRSRL